MRLLGVLASVLALSACAYLPPKSGTSESSDNAFLVHVVLVWLKQPGNSQHRAQIIQASQSLRDIPGVLDLHVGEVVSSERSVVEDSYDVALSIRFANAEDLQSYLVHPLHVQAVQQDFVPIMQRYQVIDFAAGLSD